MPPGARPWRASATGLHVQARVTPKSARDGVDGVMDTAEGPALVVRVRAAPDKGEANAAVEDVVAQWLGLARSRVSVARGTKSRVKSIHIAGAANGLEALLAARLATLR